jgi:hypothetical protein
MEIHDRWAAEKKSLFILSLKLSPIPDPEQTSHSVRLREERVKALWEGLRRRYFGETEEEPMVEEGLPPGNHPSLQEERLQEQNLVLRQQIADLMDSLRRRGVRVPEDPPSPILGFRDDDSGDPPPGGVDSVPQRYSSREESNTPGVSVGTSDRELAGETTSSPSGENSSTTRKSSRIKVQKESPAQNKATNPAPRRLVRDRFFYKPDHEVSSSSQILLLAQNLPREVSSDHEVSSSNQILLLAQNLPREVSSDHEVLSSNQILLLDQNLPREVSSSNQIVLLASFLPDTISSEGPVHLDGKRNHDNELPLAASEAGPVESSKLTSETFSRVRKVLLSQRTLRKILVAKETLFKFGTFVPRNEHEAQLSPEASRWMAGRDLEWLRMGQRETFARDWTWNRIQREFPNYKKSEIGHLFYVFDYKYSGEHRVRLVFDGSRQSPGTFTETYAPAARQESVRLFHIVLVEEGYFLGQYDVPQAFLLAPIDSDIFVYPPMSGKIIINYEVNS